MRSIHITALCVVATAALAAGCNREAPSVPAAGAPAASVAVVSDNARLEAAVDDFIDGMFQHYPTFAANAGKHEFDGKLPDYSPAGLKADADWLHAQRARFAAFGDDKLDESGRFHRDYVLAVIDGQLFWLEDSGFPYSNPAFYTGDLSPSMYLTRPYAPLPERMAAFVAYQEALPKAIAQIKANFKLPLPESYIELGVNSFGGYASFFKTDVPAIFAEVKDDALQARFKASNAAAIKATQDLADWLKAQKPHATHDYALGAEKFSRMLHATELVDLPLDQLKAIGESDLERNLAALKTACDKFAPGKPLSECVARESADKPAGGAVEGARKQLAGLRQFIVDKDLVTIPGPEQAKVEEAPPFNRWNFAYIEIPGPYEKNLPSVYYIAPPDPTWSKTDQQAYIPGKADLLFTSSHEVWPGHFLQFLHANRAHWKFGQLFVGYAFSEGWAHYAEEMMFDAGLDGATPEAHIGQLTNALLRDVRYLSAIGLHAGGMTVAQSERMFRDKAFQNPGNARQQAARGTYDPAYLNYTLGKLMIMQLRQDWIAAHPGPNALKAFHDQFLSYGGPPIPLVRARMLGGKPEARLWVAPTPATAKTEPAGSSR
ncbi:MULTISPECIES: DUF885 domain-containing protein [unclassified Rhodanobacter]|uniref:DUF885 domain-containing protein n=1 Tax=unclassified Rhodanobacter TaxID=2621553 RepID=UPI001BE0FD3F|nr:MULTISPECIES: DUF885 domain-containing protein [unclassified Rhodanobacter]MBT2144985.1 DUF885 family protein [Rhodanobacter sp. LX-99]MBT2149030.1 DUF885 family protein [Rhodanobacter sp. LX-100]